MAKAVVVLLERARAQRATAERARRLARSIPTQGVVEELERHAGDLDRAAIELERRADALARRIARARCSLNTGLRRLAGKARTRLHALRARKPRSR